MHYTTLELSELGSCRYSNWFGPAKEDSRTDHNPNYMSAGNDVNK